MSTTSSSRRKLRTTGSSRRALALAALVAAAALASCRGRAAETFVTYFSGDHGVSVRHPAAWRTDQAEQEGVWYRYFLAPPAGPQNRAPVSVTLLAGAMSVTVETYAQSYLAGHNLASTRDEERQGVRGKSWVFASADGKTRYRLLLLAADGRVVGLYAQGDAVAVEKSQATLDEMWSSLTIERPQDYPVRSWRDFETTLGVPASWTQTREFSGGGTRLIQYASPPLAVEQRKPGGARIALGHARGREGRRGAPRVLRRDAGEARRELPGVEPPGLRRRLRGRHEDRDAGRGHVHQAILLRERRPRLLAQLRGP